MHAQTLRTYDRLGLVRPRRTSGGGRRYSQHDVDLLREVQRLSQDEGVNLAGIKRIIELTNQVEALQSRIKELTAEVEELRGKQRRDLAVLPKSTAVVVWQPRRGSPNPRS
ncbi:MerR family transcriptional regulator [Mycobacterium sp. MYCO198283]|nr:MerR family transcriptional regulator [Mycobacterium sp. MYCO198283]